MTTNPNILPCPWCGQRAQLCDMSGYRPNVNCANDLCCAHGPDMDSAEEAVAAWNRVAGLRADLARAVAEEREACIAAIRARGAKEKV